MTTIADIKASLLIHPLTGDFHPTWGTGLVLKDLPLTLIELTTDSGVKGYGALPASGKEGVVGFDIFLKKQLTGADLHNTEDIARKLKNASLRMSWPWGVEMAVWDAIGKCAGLPVNALWGGANRKLKVYASLGEVRSPEARAEDAVRLKEYGFSGIKLRFRNEDVQKDIRTVEAVRKAAGDSIAVMVDANQADSLPGAQAFTQWDYPTALAVAKELQDLGVLWLEEPLPRFDFAHLSALSEKLDMKIAGGEKNQGLDEFKLLIDTKSYDILQGDCAFSDGMFQLRKAAALAEAHYLEFIPHTWSNCIGLYANLQLAASLPNCGWFEYPYEEPGWSHQVSSFLFSEGLRIKDGYVEVPDKPGLGFEPDTDKIKRFTVQ